MRWLCLKDMLSEIEQNLNKKADLDKLPMQPGDVKKNQCRYYKSENISKILSKNKLPKWHKKNLWNGF